MKGFFLTLLLIAPTILILAISAIPLSIDMKLFWIVMVAIVWLVILSSIDV